MHLSRRLTVSQKARNIFGSKSGRREGASRDDGAEGVIYKVLIPERTMYFRRADLESWPDPSAKHFTRSWKSSLTSCIWDAIPKAILRRFTGMALR